jgi:hypothetical protein
MGPQGPLAEGSKSFPEGLRGIKFVPSMASEGSKSFPRRRIGTDFAPESGIRGAHATGYAGHLGGRSGHIVPRSPNRRACRPARPSSTGPKRAAGLPVVPPNCRLPSPIVSRMSPIKGNVNRRLLAVR